MKYKRGMAVEELLQLLLAVLVIALLLFPLGVKLFSSYTQKSQDLAKARITLIDIINEANSLSEGQKRDYLVNNPAGWYLYYLEAESNEESDSLCICPAQDEISCVEDGVCENTDDIFIDRIFTDLGEGGGAEKIVNANWVILDNLPREIYFYKNMGRTEISNRKFEQPILDELLSKEIKTAAITKEIHFELFLRVNFGNSCQFDNGDVVVKLKDEAEEFIQSFIEEKTLENPDFGGKFLVYYVKDGEKYDVFREEENTIGEFRLDENKEIREICNVDFPLYVEFQITGA